MNEYCMNVLYSGFQGDTLAHHGILGMHWGLRRFQPYGQGYDADHEGREVGLAARLGGSGGSFSSTYGRGKSKGSIVERAKSAASRFGKKAYDVSQEAAERLNYGLDRAEKKAREAASRARSGLAKYASEGRTGAPQDSSRFTGNLYKNFTGESYYETASAGTLAKGVLSRFSRDAKRKVSDIRSGGMDGVKSALGSGYSRLQDAMRSTATNSKEFSKNARATASLLAGAFDPRSSASQIVEGRANNAKSRIAGGKIGPDMTRLSDMRVKKPGYQPLSKTIFGSDTKYGRTGIGEIAPWQLYRLGATDIGKKVDAYRDTYTDQSRRGRDRISGLADSLRGWRGDLGQRNDAIRRSVDRGQFRTTDSSREQQLKELGDMMRTYTDPNKQTSPYRFAMSARDGLQRLDEVITPAARGTKIDSERFKNLSSMEKRLLGL